MGMGMGGAAPVQGADVVAAAAAAGGSPMNGQMNGQMNGNGSANGNGMSNPAYPQSFAGVMKSMEGGELPAGIKQVDERVSSDASSLLRGATANAPGANMNAGAPKPWQIPQQQQQ